VSGKKHPEHYRLSLEEITNFFIIFGTNISGTTSHQMTVQHFSSPNVCFCATWGKQNQWNMSQNEWKYVKKHPQHY